MRSATKNCLQVPKPKAVFSKKLLALHIASIISGISLSFFASNAVFAQDTSDEEASADAEVLREEVVVTGIRASQRGAIDLKKSAGTMADAIVAEDVSKFPDKNVTESLQRITGVQITRDFGEGALINIRGMESGLNRIEFDGVTALGGGSRDVALTDTASELIKVLTVVKGSEARITEGGIGGTIQIEMRKANEFDEHFFSASFEEQYNDLSKDFSPDLNLTGVYKFSDDFGVMLNLNASDKHTMIHALRNTQWIRWSDYDYSPDKTVVDPDYAQIDSQYGCIQAYGPNGTNSIADNQSCLEQWWDFGPETPRYGIWERQEKRISSNLGFGWQATDELSVFGDYTYNERDKTAQDYNLQFWTGKSGGIDRDSVVVDENHSIRGFTSADAEVTNRTLQFAWLQKKSLFKIGADYISDNLEIKGIVAASESNEDIDSRDTHITSKGVAGVRITLDETGAPEFDLTSGYRYQNPDIADPDPFELFNVNNPSSYNNRSRFKYAPEANEQHEDSAKVDVTYHFDDATFFKSARTGVRWALRSLKGESYEYNLIRDVGVNYAALDSNGNPLLDSNNDPVLIEWTQADQTNLITGALQTTPRFFPNFDLGVGTLENYQAVNTNILIDRLQGVSATSVSRNALAPKAGKYYIEEQTYAAYLQIDFEQEIADMRFWGNAGVRYARTETLSEGDVTIVSVYDINDDGLAEYWDWDGSGPVDYNATPNYTFEDVTDDNGSYYGTVEATTFDARDTSKGAYDDLLPSLNLNLEVIPEVLNFYAGASKTMARPAITTLNINAACKRYATFRSRQPGSTLTNTCKAGNPDIAPYRATQMDIAVMWYPNEDSLVSAAYFTKELTSYLGPDIVSYDNDFFAGGANGGVLYDVTQPDNINGVTTKGVELQGRTMFTMLPEPFSNMGVDANYTWMTAEDVPYVSQLDSVTLSLLGQSGDTFNLTGFYEDDNWSARLAYNYRSTYLALAADRGGNPVYVEDAGHLDAKVSYVFGDSGFTVFADARNLLSAVKLETAGEGRLSDLQWAGRTFALGFTYKM